MNPQPLFLEDLAREICAYSEMPPVPSSVRRYFLLLLRAHWSDPANYGPDLQESLGCLRWTPEGEGGNLAVYLHGTEQNKVPGICIMVGGFQFRKLTFNNRAGYEVDNATDYYVMPVSCQVLLQHHAASADQALDMAWSSACFLLGFREAIMAAIGADSFEPEILGEARLAEAADKTRFRIDLGCRLGLNCVVATTVESHRLKEVTLGLNATTP